MKRDNASKDSGKNCVHFLCPHCLKTAWCKAELEDTLICQHCNKSCTYEESLRKAEEKGHRRSMT